VGIAGHRDSFFRRLKDVGTGELIEVVTETEKNDYVVTRTTVVTPSDVGVLRTSSAMAITLVTCYPFYMVGDAPYRYVVQTSFITQVRKELNNAARHKGEQHMHRLKDFSLCRIGLAVTALGLTLVLGIASAQDASTSSAQTGQPTTTTEVKSGTIVYVSGNDVVVKLDDGTVKHVVVPDTTTITVDGKDLTVHDLQPGMKVTRTITTTTTPVTVQTIRTVKGKVW
jgi:hypothetical protein